MFGFKIWKINGGSMAPVIPAGSFVLTSKWSQLLPVKEGQRIVIDHPVFGIIVKTVAVVDRNGFVWSKGENHESLPVEKLGPVNRSDILGRVMFVFRPEASLA